jgi:hypothetical protein
MKLEKIFPKFSSFLPGVLGMNMGDLQSESFQEKGIVKKEKEITKEELQQNYQQKKQTAIMGELIRDVPTIGLTYLGGIEVGLFYYLGATWFEDRWAYFLGCAGV